MQRKREFNAFDMGKATGNAERLKADLALQLAVFGHKELCEEIEMPGTGKMRQATGGFGMIADQLEKYFPHQHTKEVLSLTQRIRAIELWLYNMEETFRLAHWLDDNNPRRQEAIAISKYFNTCFGSLRSIIISFTRSKRTMVAADTKIPSMIPEAEIKARMRQLEEEGEKSDFSVRITPEEMLDEEI